MTTITQVVERLQWRCQGKYRIRQYLVKYLQTCMATMQPAQIITLWCLSKGLERRLKLGGEFTPLSGELKVLEDFGWCHRILAESGLVVNHFIFLVGSGVERGQIASEVAGRYQTMLESHINRIGLDVLLGRRAASRPDDGLLNKLRGSEPSSAVTREIDRRLRLAAEQKVWLTKPQACAEATKSIAVKAAEAKDLINEFGDFALIPVEYVERYQFHNLGVPAFTDRLLPITQTYPWRLYD